MENQPYQMDLGEFQDFGFLQEANRQFFHPLGLALTVSIDDAGGRVALYVQDWRPLDNEGGAFKSLADEGAKLKAERVAALHSEIAGVRTQKFGWNIQPIGHEFKESI